MKRVKWIISLLFGSVVLVVLLIAAFLAILYVLSLLGVQVTSTRREPVHNWGKTIEWLATGLEGYYFENSVFPEDDRGPEYALYLLEPNFGDNMCIFGGVLPFTFDSESGKVTDLSIDYLNIARPRANIVLLSPKRDTWKTETWIATNYAVYHVHFKKGIPTNMPDLVGMGLEDILMMESEGVEISHQSTLNGFFDRESKDGLKPSSARYRYD